MKTVAALVGAAVLAVNAPQTAAWWDNGHMLVGEVAVQMMDPKDVETIQSVLSDWEQDFPNTNTIPTASIWPDLVKCTKQVSYCKSPLMPSLYQMDEWHYINLPLNVDGSKWKGKGADMDLFKDALAGDAVDFLEKSVRTMETTKSRWAVNFMLRNFIHTFGDIHQPLHNVGGVSEANPNGDLGGNLYKFRAPCPYSNLHAMWDAASGEYALNNWAPEIDFLPQLKQNATDLISMLPIVTELIDLDKYRDVPYEEFRRVMVKGNMLKMVSLDSYNYATTFVYPGLNLEYDEEKKVECPPEWYAKWSATIAKFRVAQGGKRLAIFLTQFARQIRHLGLEK